MSQEECYWSETATLLNFDKELDLVVSNAKKCWEYIDTIHKLEVPHICISLTPITIHLTYKKNDYDLYFEIRANDEIYVCYGDTNLRHKTYLYLDTLKTSKELEDILLLFAVN